MTTQDKDLIECAIRHIQTAVDVDPWAVDIAVEAMKTQLSAEGTTFDLISRHAAIDAAIKADMENNSNVLSEKRASVIERHISAVPSAHPEIEERTKEFAQNVPKEDLISRKAAIDAINKALDRETLLNSFVRKVAVDALKTMPSAEPEIVRCKDCQHFRTYYHGTESDPVITHACVWFLDREMGLEDYCSKGVIR